MKKLALSLLIALITITGVSFAAGPLDTLQMNGGGVQTMNTPPSSLNEADRFKKNPNIKRPTSISTLKVETKAIVNLPTEQGKFCDDIPLTYKEQECLQAACEEFDVPYALVLGLIEKETDFRNITGDNGASTGYMQIQKKWHWQRMERLGVADLAEPSENFRVGCDFLSELYRKYNDWNVALTVYNMGHDPGFVTDYAKEVMKNYAHWQELLETYI